MSAKPETPAKEKSAVQAAEKKTLDLALSAINKQYGDGTLMRMGDATKMTVSTVSTGSVAIDLALADLVPAVQQLIPEHGVEVERILKVVLAESAHPLVEQLERCRMLRVDFGEGKIDPHGDEHLHVQRRNNTVYA